MKFTQLVSSIQHTHNALQQQAVKAVNRSLTVRNWLIGFYIVEFEQKGEDRAAYGEKLLSAIAKSISVKGLSETNLKLNRQFYLTYPHIRQTLSDKSWLLPIGQTLSDELIPQHIIQTLSNEPQTPIPGLPTQESEEAAEGQELAVPSEKLITNLSFSHFTELIKIGDPLKRAYYELIAIKCTLSVRDLKRQIATLSYERTGLSKNKQLSLQKLATQVKPQTPAQAVRDFYIFDFLNLPGYSGIEENELETALLTHLQEFLLELGHGFCFEARQKRLLIGGEYFFIDLVLYHRILKCHVLIDLKVEGFNHTNAGQLNTYLNYYKKEVSEKSDNPPVGILMVTDKNTALVEYATAGMDNHLFVSKYLVQLPSKEELTQFVQNELKNL